MNARALCIGQYIAATDFGIPGVIDDAEPTFTIGPATRERMADMKNVGKEVEKGIVYFSDYPRGWVMNKTNLQCLIALFGEDTKQWEGKRVTLMSATVNVGRERKPGIRIKGSPDLREPMNVVVQLPKKSPVTMTMVPTGRPNNTNGSDRGQGEKPREPAGLRDGFASIGIKYEDAIPTFREMWDWDMTTATPEQVAELVRDLADKDGEKRLAFEEVRGRVCARKVSDAE